MTREQIEEMEAGQEMDRAVAELMEACPSSITARAARASVRGFQWASCHYYRSEGGWWQAEIGTDHGPPEDDDKPVRWVPAKEPSTDIEATFDVLNHLINSRAETVQWTINGLHPGSGDAPVFGFAMHDFMNAEVITSSDGDSIPEAICRAALIAKLAEIPANGG